VHFIVPASLQYLAEPTPGISSASWLSTFLTTMKIERTWVSRRTRPWGGRPPSAQPKARFDPSRDSVDCIISTRPRLKAIKSCFWTRGQLAGVVEVSGRLRSTNFLSR